MENIIILRSIDLIMRPSSFQQQFVNDACVGALLALYLPISTGALHWRQSEDMDMLDMEGSGGDNMTTSTTPTMREPILSPTAIANIICSVLAVVFLTAVLCFLMRSFNANERKTSIRTSRENNRRIDEQIAAAKARAEKRTQQSTSSQVQDNLKEPSEVPIVGAEQRPQDVDLKASNTTTTKASDEVVTIEFRSSGEQLINELTRETVPGSSIS